MSCPERQIKEIIYLTLKILLNYAKQHDIPKEEIVSEINDVLLKYPEIY